MTGGVGVDYAFEVIGLPATIETCVKAARRGGMAVLVGVGRAEERFSVNSLILPLTSKTIRGCMYAASTSRWTSRCTWTCTGADGSISTAW